MTNIFYYWLVLTTLAMDDYDYIGDAMPGQDILDGEQDIGVEGQDYFVEDGSEGEDYEGEQDFGGGASYKDEDMNFDLDFERQRSLTYEKETGTDYVEGISKKIQRLQQSPEDVYINQLRFIMSNNLDLSRDDTKRAKIEEIARKRKDLVLLHPPTFLLAALWIAQKKEATEFKKFFKSYENKFDEEVNEVDFYRYIRLLK